LGSILINKYLKKTKGLTDDGESNILRENSKYQKFIFLLKWITINILLSSIIIIILKSTLDFAIDMIIFVLAAILMIISFFKGLGAFIHFFKWFGSRKRKRYLYIYIPILLLEIT
jgi:hypothetical protein